MAVGTREHRGVRQLISSILEDVDALEITEELPGEASSHWQKHMPRHGLMWRETDFWGDLALDLSKEQLQRPETCRCIHDCHFCREQRQTLKEEKPRIRGPPMLVEMA
eukprot:s1330_g20.t1